MSTRTTDLISERLGFGCGRLKGGSEKTNSLRLIHTALDLGIRHFDTAPPYGLGASEPVLGEALKGRHDVIVVTKVGLPRPSSPSLVQTARAIVKPLAARIPGLQQLVLKGMTMRAPPANFSIDFVARSIESSLRLLQRERIDYLLMHEPQLLDELLKLNPLLDRYVADGVLGAYGSSTGDPLNRAIHFGAILQYRCPEPGVAESTLESSDILHGVIRFVAPAVARAMARDAMLKEQLFDLLSPEGDASQASGPLALAYTLACCENRLLFSTDNPIRLVSTVRELRHITSHPRWRTAMQTLKAAIDGQA